MQFNTDTSLWTRCADKFLVREYIKECGCENLQNTLYGKWDSPDEIDYDMLPDQFVLKRIMHAELLSLYAINQN